MRAVGFFCEHPLQHTLHAQPAATIEYKCPRCPKTFAGVIRDVLAAYRDHVRIF